MICCIPQPFFVAACLLPSALSSKKGWTPMTSAFRKTPGVEKPHIETIRNYWHSGSATVKQLALQATLHLFQVLLLEMVHFLRLCAVQNFSLIVGVTSAKKHTTSKMAKDIKTWSKVCHPAAISVDNHKHSQPCQARIPRPSRSSHSCHKIRKYQKSLEYVNDCHQNQCWESDTACDTFPSPCTCRVESHSSGAVAGSASALCCAGFLNDSGDEWEELGGCFAGK